MKTFVRKFSPFVVVILLLAVTAAYAVNKILVAKGTPITFADSAQTPTKNLTMTALAAGTGCTTACTRCSAIYTKTGNNAKSQYWEMRPTVQLTGTNVVNESIEYYVALSDGTDIQGNIATTDGTIDVNKKKNLTFAGVLVVDQTTTNTSMKAAFQNIFIPTSDFSVCVSNQTTLPFKTDTGVHIVKMTPMNIEVQNNE